MRQYRIVLASHGNIANAMLEAVELFTGSGQDIAAYGLQRDMTEEMFMAILRKELLQYGEDHVLFFSDLEFGTPCNALMLLTREYPGLCHITGMNLSGILGAVSACGRDGISLEEVREEALSSARNGVMDMREEMMKMMQEEETEQD